MSVLWPFASRKTEGHRHSSYVDGIATYARPFYWQKIAGKEIRPLPHSIDRSCSSPTVPGIKRDLPWLADVGLLVLRRLDS
ncbi:uncharacterized protein CTRU02_211905 [Colletotrichum truncatum]|uniref:Uncharacterized protein n=1 Tax=Colletotrichum truncatum TaxID=5467 RepID=A0ACC3YP48_COLTU